MVEVAVTTVSSRGQVVIPHEMREGFEEGEKLVVVKEGKSILMKPAKDFDKNMAEDLEFARRTEEALKRYERGEFKEMNFDKFLEQAKKW